MVERVIILFLAFAVLWVVFYFIAKLVRQTSRKCSTGTCAQPISPTRCVA